MKTTAKTFLMKRVHRRQMNGLSLHYYTVDGTWQKMKSATQFDEGEHFALIEKCLALDSLLAGHVKIMDEYDPENRIGLMVDEWGAWHEAAPGSTPGFLYQQNTLRDAFVAALSLNIFHQHGNRVKMTNIAQTVNVLQAMILTDKEKSIPLECELKGIKAIRVSGKILTAKKLNSHNTFGQPDDVKIADFNKAALRNNLLEVEMPAKSVVVLNVK